MRPEVRVSEQLTEDAARLISDAAERGGHVVLTGGSTPKDAYERAAELRADWSATEVWFSDERCVPSTHEHSNYRMAHDSLLGAIAPREVHRMPGEAGPHHGAEQYERELVAAFGPEVVPRFDLILLGLGPDSHTASLFPSSPELGIRDRSVAGVDQPGMAPLVPRITLTMPVLNAGAQVVVLVSGESKAEAVARAFGGPPDPAAPASLLEPEGEYVLLCDPPAASQLRR